jgi:hypothetical protein
MRLDGGALLGGERAGLVEDAVGDAELPDVVQQPGAVQPALGVRAGAARPGDARGVVGHALGVARRVRRLRVDDPGEGARHRVETVLVHPPRVLARLERRHRGHGVGRAQRLPPRRVAAPAAGRGHEPRVEPAPGALARHAQRHLGPVRVGERLERLREVGDARAERDGVAAQPVRVAAPVPVLVEGAHDRRRLVGEAELAGDVGAAVAADADQVARHVGRARDADERRTCSASGPPSPAVRNVATARRTGRCQSTAFMRGFTTRSSAPNSAHMRAALLEQPASLRRSA